MESAEYIFKFYSQTANALTISNHRAFSFSQTISEQINLQPQDCNPIQLYLKVNFSLTVNPKSPLHQLKTLLFPEIKYFMRNLFRKLLPFSLMAMDRYNESTEKEQFSFKQFICMNFLINIMSITKCLNKNFNNQFNQKQVTAFKNWTNCILYNLFAQNISKFKEYYSPSIQKESENGPQIKRYIKNVDRRQNESYDLILAHNICYKNSKQLLLSVLDTIGQFSDRNYKQSEQLHCQVFYLFQFILEPEKHQKNQTITTYIQRNLLKKNKNCKVNSMIKQKIFFEYCNYGWSLNYTSSDYPNFQSYIRLLQIFIKDIHRLIENPQNTTIKRIYAYKNYNNEFINPNQKLNKILHQNLLNLKKDLNIGNISKRLRFSQEYLFKHQNQFLFSLDTQSFLKKQIRQSRHRSYNTIIICLEYLTDMIQLIINAGKIVYQGQRLEINLINFKIDNLFQAKKVVSTQDVGKIMENIYKIDNPRIVNDFSGPQRIFRLLQIKENTQKHSQGVVINLLFHNKYPCEIQITTNKQQASSLQQISSLLDQLQNNRFGILNQLLYIITPKCEQFERPSNHLIACSDEQIKQTPLKAACQQIYNTQILEEQAQSQYLERMGKPSWTNVYFQSQISYEDVNRYRSAQVISNQTCQLILKDQNRYPFRLDFIKYVAIDGKTLKNSFKLEKLKECPFIERMSINNYGWSRAQKMDNISFINTNFTGSLIQLDLSYNQLTNFEQFHRKWISPHLKILNLSNNKFAHKIKFQPQWYPFFQKLVISQNQIDIIQIDDQIGEEDTYIQQFISSQVLQNSNLYFSHEFKGEKVVCVYTNVKRLEIFVNKLYKGQKFQIVIFKQSQMMQYRNSVQQHIIKDDYKRNIGWPFPIRQTQKNNTKSQQTTVKSQRQPQRQSQQMKQFKVLLKKQSGRLINLITKKQFGCKIIGNSKIIVSSAHAVINYFQLKDWRNSQQHNQIKAKIISRLRVLSSQQIENKIEDVDGKRLQQIWICEEYLQQQDHTKDIAILFLQQTTIPQIQEDESKVSIAFTKRSKQIYALLYSGLAVGRLLDKQFGCSFTGIKFNKNKQCVQFIESVPYNLNCESSTFYLQKKGKYFKMYLIGKFHRQTEYKISQIAILGKQFITQYQNKINCLITSKQQVGISYKSNYQLKFKIQKMKSARYILCQMQNQLSFISKLFKKINYFLQKYLYFDATQFIDKQQRKHLISNIFISNQYASQQKQFQIDLFGFPISTIFPSLIQRNAYQKDYFLIINKIQQSTIIFINEVLYQIREIIPTLREKIDQIKVFIYMQMMSNSPKNPISLIKILDYIAQIIEFREIMKIQQYRTNQNEDFFVDRQYYTAKNLFSSLNVLKKIQYFAQVFKITKIYFHYSQLQPEPLQKYFNVSIKKQLRSQLSKNSIQRTNSYYLHELQVFVNGKSQEIKQQNVIINQFRQKIILIQTFKRYYQISLNKYSKDSIQQLRYRGLAMLNQKIQKLVKETIQTFNLIDQMDIQSINNMFKSSINEQIDMLISLTKYALIDESRNQQLINSSVRCNSPNIEQESQKQMEYKSHFQRYQCRQLLNIEYYIDDFRIIRKPLNNKFKDKKISSNVGLVLIYDLPDRQNSNDWIKFIQGIGTLIEERIVIISAHLMKPIIGNQLLLGKIRFKLLDQQRPKIVANFIEVRLLRNSDVAFLILDERIPQTPRIRLISWLNLQQRSVFSQRHLFCKLIGYKIDNYKKKYQLMKAEGILFMKFENNLNLYYNLPVSEGHQGGPIIFYPTGNLQQPFILGIHGKKANTEYVLNDKTYFKQMVSCGCKILFSDINQENYEIITAQTFKKNSLKIQTVCDRSLMFSKTIIQIRRWKLVKSLSKILDQKNLINRNFLATFFSFVRHWNLGLIIQDIHPDNIICFDYNFYSFYAVNVRYEKKRDIQIRQQAIRSFQKFINICWSQYTAAQIVDDYLTQIEKIADADCVQIIQQIYERILKNIRKQIKQISVVMEGRQHLLKQFVEKLLQYQKLGRYVVKNKYFQQSNNLINILQPRPKQTQKQRIDYFSKQYKNWQRDKNRKRRYDKSSQSTKILDKKQKRRYNQTSLNAFFNADQQFSKFIQSLEKNQKRKIIEVKYQILKIACESVYRFYQFCQQNNIQKKVQDNFIKYSIIYPMKLSNNLIKFLSIQQTTKRPSYSPYLIPDFQLQKRFSAVKLIVKCIYLRHDKKQKLLREIFNWRVIEEEIQDIQMKPLLNQKQFRKDTINSYLKLVDSLTNFNSSQNDFVINNWKIINQEINFLQKICKKIAAVVHL